MAFADRLAGIPGATLIPQDESGLPDIAGVFAGSPDGTHVYCCGPAAMLAVVEDISSRHPRIELHVEKFTAGASPPTDRAADGAFDVELAKMKESGEFAAIIEPYGFSAAAAMSTSRAKLCGE